MQRSNMQVQVLVLPYTSMYVFYLHNYLFKLCSCMLLNYGTCLKISKWNSYQEQLEMDTEICRL